MSRRGSVAGALLVFPVAASTPVLRLAHDENLRHSNHTANQRVRGLFFVCCLLGVKYHPRETYSAVTSFKNR